MKLTLNQRFVAVLLKENVLKWKKSKNVQSQHNNSSSPWETLANLLNDTQSLYLQYEINHCTTLMHVTFCLHILSKYKHTHVIK